MKECCSSAARTEQERTRYTHPPLVRRPALNCAAPCNPHSSPLPCSLCHSPHCLHHLLLRGCAAPSLPSCPAPSLRCSVLCLRATPTLTPSRLVARSPPPPQCSAPLPKRTRQPQGGRPRIRECSGPLRAFLSSLKGSCWTGRSSRSSTASSGPERSATSTVSLPAIAPAAAPGLALLRLRPYGAGCSQMCPASTSTRARSW